MNERDAERFDQILQAIDDRNRKQNGLSCWASFGAGCLLTMLGLLLAFQIGAF
tara:strand:- start:153 stop:311 length:159 start_codon:yes stop_codon:yes gene_type:complete